MERAINERKYVQAVLCVIGAAVLFSTGGAAVKVPAFSGLQVASIRSGIAAVTLFVWLRGAITWSGPALGIGAVYACTLVLFVTATKLTTAANAIFLQSAAPLYIALLAPRLLGERFRSRDVGFLLAVGTGLGMCFAGSLEATATSPSPGTGNLLGVLSGVAWALTLMGFRWGERRRAGTAMSAVVAGNLAACLFGAGSLWPVPSASAAEWATLAYLGVFQIAGAYVLLTGAVGQLPALHVALLLLLEPVLNPLWTWLLRGEQPGAWPLAGGAIIVMATAAQAVIESRRPGVATKDTKTE